MHKKLSEFIVLLFLTLLCVKNAYCWNALGHRLVAQIAYNHLTEPAKQKFNHYNQALDKIYKPQSLVNSAAWLDSLRYEKDLWLKAKHYINLPFSVDGTPLIAENKANAVSAIKAALNLIQAQGVSDFDKGFSLRIILHVVGDIHQPLHASSQFSARYPRGDLGGNRFVLKANPVAKNLHSYWDRGGGYLTAKKRFSQKILVTKAYLLEKRWPCDPQKMNLDPQAWAAESQSLAQGEVYKIKPGQKPSKQYQQATKSITEQRLALAGCRLAALLNQLA